MVLFSALVAAPRMSTLLTVSSSEECDAASALQYRQWLGQPFFAFYVCLRILLLSPCFSSARQSVWQC